MCNGNIGLMTYNAGSYLTSAISNSRISIRVNDSVSLGSYDWCTTCAVCQEYVMIVDSYWMGRSTEPNSVPLCLPINALSKQNLLDKLNLLAYKKSVPSFNTLLDAMDWAQGQGIFVTNQNYPSITTNNNVLFMDAGLPASYPMDGTQWFNMAANNNIGTINGGTTFVDTDVNDPWGHLQFNGSTGHVSFSAATNIPTGGSSYTIGIWFNADTLSNMGLIGWGTYANNNQSNSIKITSTGIINSWGTNQLSASTVVTTGSWHNIVATFDGTTRKLYYDGSMVASDTPTGLNVVGSSNLTIGKVDTQYFDGGVSLVQIFGNAITDTDVSISYQNFSPKYDGTCLDVCPEEVFCVTPTPTPTCDNFFVPGLKEFTPLNCQNNCYDYIQQSFDGGGYTAFTHCLDLSNGYYATSSTVTIAWDAYDRPDRFNLYINGSLSQTSGWVGYDNTYSGPWGGPGSVNTVATSSAFTFTYNPGDTYEIRVDVGPENPSNPLSDSYTLSIQCPTIPPTPTPTPTSTSLQWYCPVKGGSEWKWFIYETGYSNFGYPNGTYNPTTKTLVGLPASFTPPVWSYNGYMRVIVWNCYNSQFYIVDQWTTRRGNPIRNWPSNQLKQLPVQTNVYVSGLFTIPPFNT